MPICEGCSGSFDNTFSFCPYCGRVKPTEKKSIIETHPENPSSSGTECPLCHRDDKVAKVTAIIQRDTQSISGSLPITSTYSDSDGRLRSSTDWSNFSGTQISNLAEKLNPPTQPSRSYISSFDGSLKALAVIFVIISAAPIGVLLSGYFREAENAAGFALFCIIAGSGLWFGAIKLWKQGNIIKQKGIDDLKPRMDQWNHAMNRWNKLYYCSRDDCVYIPGEKQSKPLSYMVDFLIKE